MKMIRLFNTYIHQLRIKTKTCGSTRLRENYTAVIWRRGDQLLLMVGKIENFITHKGNLKRKYFCCIPLNVKNAF